MRAWAAFRQTQSRRYRLAGSTRAGQNQGWKLPPGVVLADEAYGGSFEWRAALRKRGLFYCVRVPWTTTGWQEAPRFGLPEPVRRGRPALRGPLLSPEPKHLLAIAQALPAAAWKIVTWRQGTKGPQRSRFTTFRLWAAHGWKQGPQPERIEETALIQAALVRLCGRCPWCHTRFHPPDST